MPKISDTKIKTSKKFQKKEYRPWDAPEVKKDFVEKVPKLVKEVVLTKPINLVDSEPSEKNKLDTVYLGANIKQSLEKVKRGLFGPQEKTLKYLIGKIESEDDHFHYISPVYYSEASEELDVTIYSMKANFNKFKKLGLIELVEFKPGRGGYCFFRISKKVVDFFSD